MSGWFKLYRGFRDNPAFTKSDHFSDVEAWIWLIENAAWKDMQRRSGLGAMINIERGQMHVSLASLASVWGWSVKRVRTYLSGLEKMQMVGTVRAHSGTILTICNYGKYQDGGHSSGTEEGTEGAHSGHTQEESKEIKKERKIYKPASPLAFEGKIIRLNERDYQAWRKAYPTIDMDAALQSRDDWLSTDADETLKKNWFIATSNWLNRQAQNASKANQPRTAQWQPGDALC